MDDRQGVKARGPATEGRPEREFRFEPRDFEQVRRLIHDRAGISLSSAKEDMVYSRLVRRLRTLSLSSFREYLERLDDPASPEWEGFINALTTNLTSFFREPHHFERLAELLLDPPRGSPHTLWSTAVSTGEEAYSMAMTAIETLGPRPPVRIIATDVDTQVLRVAERGVYPVERVADMDPVRRRRFFLRGTGRYAGQCRVVDELRNLVVFRPLNLLAPEWSLRGPFKAIFCRNVMIYFDKQTQHRVLERIVPLLTDDGLLFAGHSESFLHAADLVTPCGRTIYRRADRLSREEGRCT